MEAISARPNYGPPYALASILFRRLDRLEEARDLLLRGLEADASGSAELHYFLGLIFLDLGDIEAAQTHADKAEALGYPLSGLQKAIARRTGS